MSFFPFTGIGIDEDHLLSIFQPFSNVDQSLVRPYGGLGLGLRMGDDYSMFSNVFIFSGPRNERRLLWVMFKGLFLVTVFASREPYIHMHIN